ncbi:hypothetical protein EON65_05785 [archaeon]|nr:MAG: hypothetical protein EON65_05785 [archaeon]
MELLQQSSNSPNPLSSVPHTLHIQPPKDVQLAIAMARAQQQQNQSEGSNKYSLGAQLPPGAKWRYVAYSPDSPS